jgi:hypothetical protein
VSSVKKQENRFTEKNLLHIERNFKSAGALKEKA